MKSLGPMVPIAVGAALALFSAPREQAHAQSAPAAPLLRVAILSGKSVEGEADLLTARLPQSMPELLLLERADLAVVATEGALISGKLPPSLESADVLLVIEAIEIETENYLTTRVVGRDDGNVFASDLRRRNQIGDEWAVELAGKLKAFTRTKSVAVPGTVPNVALRVIREEFSPGAKENELVSVALTRLLNAELSKVDQIRVLERVDLPLVQFERYLTRIDSASFELADQIISGTFRSGDGATRFEILVETPRIPEFEKAQGTVPSENLGEIAAAIRAEILPLLRDTSGQPTMTPVKMDDLNTYARSEAGRFATEADRALRLGLHQSAANFAETAHLLDPVDGFDSLYVFASADLIASIPSLRGRGVSLGGLSVENPGGRRSERFEAISLFPGQTSDEIPALPGEEVWPGLALAMERLTDMTRRVLAAEKKDPKSYLRQKRSSFGRMVSKVANEAILNSFCVWGASIPLDEKEYLMRIGNARQELIRINGEALKDGGKGITLPLDGLPAFLLISSPGQAVTEIHDRLYGEPTGRLQRKADDRYSADWRKARSIRFEFFDYFGYLGYDEELDKGVSGIDTRLLRKPFLAWLSGNPIDLETAFSQALAAATEEDSPLPEIDAQFQITGVARSQEDREKEFEKLHQLIRESLEVLQSSGLLEIYALKLADWESARIRPPMISDRGAFWKEIHAAVYANQSWVSGNFTEQLAWRSDAQNWPTEETVGLEMRRDFLTSLQRDVSGNTNPFCEAERTSAMKEIEKQLTALKAPAENPAPPNPDLSDTRAVQGLPGIPEDETIDLTYSSYGYSLPTLATDVTEEGIFQFQVGRFGYEPIAHILTFDLTGKLSTLAVPERVYELIQDALGDELPYQLGRFGDLRVSKDRIDIVFPGGIAAFDRNNQKWDVTPGEFLKKRHGVRIVGDKIVSFTGRVESIPDLPVHGMYLTDPGTKQNVAVIDTSRRPSRFLMDNSKSLQFTFPPLAYQEDSIVFGMTGNVQDYEIFRFQLRMELEDPNHVRHYYPIPIPFAPGPGARLHGSSANGYALIAATRKIYPPDYKSGTSEGKLLVGAFALDREGKYHWLLDTGTIPAVSTIPVTNEMRRDRKMILSSITEPPLYSFPEAFSTHHGRLCSAPVIHYNGTRLLLLTGQITTDGRRLLYYWKNPEENTPKRFALRFASFDFVKDLSEEEKSNWNRTARDSILSIFEWRDRIVFEYPRGFFSMPLADFEKRLSE